jgi:hypothetical protein
LYYFQTQSGLKQNIEINKETLKVIPMFKKGFLLVNATDNEVRKVAVLFRARQMANLKVDPFTASKLLLQIFIHLATAKISTLK